MNYITSNLTLVTRNLTVRSTLQATFICITLLFGRNSHSQTLQRPISAGYTGLGAYSIKHTDVFSFTSNPAALSQMTSAAVGVYGERRFWLNELNNYIAAVALPTSSGNFGLRMGYFGFSDYNETQIGLAYARKLGSKVDIGAQFNYHGFKISGYGDASTVSFELGTVLHFTERIHGGIHIANPVGGKFGKDETEKIPSLYSLGIGYDASEKFFVSTEIEKEEDKEVNVNAGLQYRFIPQLLARVGVSTGTSSVWFGLGLNLHGFRLDITTAYHPQLGISPGLLLLYQFNSLEK